MDMNALFFTIGLALGVLATAGVSLIPEWWRKREQLGIHIKPKGKKK